MKQLRGFCHGDDAAAVVFEEAFAKLRAFFAQNFGVRLIGMAGFGNALDKEFTVLSRMVRASAERD
eukprot:7558898-Lingulodinium_polyedra.AAC.1